MSESICKIALLIISLLFSWCELFAADFNKGRELYHALGCVACHGGKNGSLLEGYPSLVDTRKEFIQSELNKYRNGVRKDPTMSAMAANLSDRNIQDLADYIANR